MQELSMHLVVIGQIYLFFILLLASAKDLRHNLHDIMTDWESPKRAGKQSPLNNLKPINLYFRTKVKHFTYTYDCLILKLNAS